MCRRILIFNLSQAHTEGQESSSASLLHTCSQALLVAYLLTCTAAQFNPPGTYPAAQANGAAEGESSLLHVSFSCMEGDSKIVLSFLFNVSEPAALVKLAISGILVITVRLL